MKDFNGELFIEFKFKDQWYRFSNANQMYQLLGKNFEGVGSLVSFDALQEEGKTIRAKMKLSIPQMFYSLVTPAITEKNSGKIIIHQYFGAKGVTSYEGYWCLNYIPIPIFKKSGEHFIYEFDVAFSLMKGR